MFSYTVTYNKCKQHNKETFTLMLCSNDPCPYNDNQGSYLTNLEQQVTPDVSINTYNVHSPVDSPIM